MSGDDRRRAQRLDAALLNMFTGMGVAGVDVARATVRRHVRMSRQQAEREFEGSWAAQREILRPAQDLISQPMTLTDLPAWADQKATMAYLANIGQQQMPEDRGALPAMSRLFEESAKGGGAAAVMVILDGLEQWEPVDFARIQDLASIEILDRDEIHPWRSTPGGPVDFYTIGTARTELAAANLIHASRVIVARGLRLGPRDEYMHHGWGVSRLDALATERLGLHTANSEAVSLLTASGLDVIEIAELAELMESEPDRVLERVQMMALCKGRHRTLPIDAGREANSEAGEHGRPGDKYNALERPTRGLHDLGEQVTNHWASGTGQTPSIALGQTSGPLSTGDNAGDWQSWSSHMTGLGETWLAPRMRTILDVAFAATLGPTGGRVPPDGWGIEFGSLWEPSELERAQIRETDARTDAIYVDMGAAKPSEVREQRLEQGAAGQLSLDPLPEGEEITPPADPGEAPASEEPAAEPDPEADALEQAWSDAAPPDDAGTATAISAQLDGVTAQAIHRMAADGKITRYRSLGYSDAPVFSLAEVKRALLIKGGHVEEDEADPDETGPDEETEQLDDGSRQDEGGQ